MHTHTDHAQQITARGAALLLQAKGSQPTLHTQLKALPWAQVLAADRTRETGHGRKQTRTVKAVTLHTPGEIAFPHAQQARPDHPDPHHRRQGQPRDRLPDHLPARGRRSTRRPAEMGATRNDPAGGNGVAALECHEADHLIGLPAVEHLRGGRISLGPYSDRGGHRPHFPSSFIE
jgi:hypothetical protein